MSECVLLKHGYYISYPNFEKNGVCCYNRKSTYPTYEVNPQDCRTCINEEQSGVQSYRQGANLKYPIETVSGGIVLLDVTPNINCNLACKICSEQSSTTWSKIKKIKIDKDAQITYDDFAKKMSTLDLTNLKEINFSGGEPLLNKNIMRYLSCLENMSDLSNIELRFSTNGTQVVTDDVNKFFEKFKLVLARFSLDDIEHGHEYHRYPANWDEWLLNWKDFLERMPVNVLPSINRTVGLLNINRLEHLENWHKNYSHTKLGDPIELIDHFVFGITNLSNITRDVKSHIKCKGEDSTAWKYVKHKIPSENSSHLLMNIKLNDQLHNQSFKEYDEEMYNLLFRGL